MVIGVDVDGPIADLMSEWLRRYNQGWGDNLTEAKITDWDFSGQTKCGTKIYEYLTADIYLDVRPVRGALAAIRQLRKDGHTVLFVTSVPAGSYDAKLEWLRRYKFIEGDGVYGDGRVFADYIPVHQKDLLKLDVLIDDRIENIQGFSGAGIIFTKPWNTSYFSFRRADDWETVLLYIQSLAIQQAHEAAKAAMPEQPREPVWVTVAGNTADTMVSNVGAGVKYDQDKLDWSLLPWAATAEVVKVLMHGARKYAAYNWAQGMAWTRLGSAAIRHIAAWFSGQDYDEESGLHHLAHAACCVLFLLSYNLASMDGGDDRPFGSSVPAVVLPDTRYEKRAPD